MVVAIQQKPSPVETSAKAFGEVAKSTDTLKKTSSVIIAIIDIIGEVFGFFPQLGAASAGLDFLKGRLKDTKNVIGATSVLGRGYEWIDSETRNQTLKSWQKTANRAFLTVAQVMETLGFADKMSVGFFSQPAACVGGVVPIFDIVKNAFYATSAFFGLWKSSLELKYSNDVIDRKSLKMRKWEQVSDKISFYECKLEQLGRSEELKAELDERKTDLIQKHEELSQASGKEKSRLNDQFKEQAKAFTELKITYYKARKYEIYTKVLAEDQDHGVERIKAHKAARHEVHIHNHKNNRTRAWISIVAEIGKIFMIVVGTALAIISAVAFPVLSVVGVTLALASCNLLATSFGVAKNLYRDVFHSANVQNLPQPELLLATST